MSNLDPPTVSEHALLIEFAAPGKSGTIGIAWTLHDATRMVRNWQCDHPLASGQTQSDWIPLKSEDCERHPLEPARKWTAALGNIELTLSALPLTAPPTRRYSVPGLPDQLILESRGSPVLVCGRDPDCVPYLAARLSRTEYKNPDDAEFPFEVDIWQVLRINDFGLEDLVRSHGSLVALHAAAKDAQDVYRSILISVPGKDFTVVRGIEDDDLWAAKLAWSEATPQGDFDSRSHPSPQSQGAA